MINKDSIVTAYDEHLTLVEWLQKVEKALDNAVLKNLGIAKLSDQGNVATYQVTATFADNTTIVSDTFTLPSTDIVTAFSNLTSLVNGFDTRITDNTNKVAINFNEITNIKNGTTHLFENITDSDGNKRFQAWNIDIPTANPFKDYITYAKATLSGSHLMVVVCGYNNSGESITYSDEFASVPLPPIGVMNKIYPLNNIQDNGNLVAIINVSITSIEQPYVTTTSQLHATWYWSKLSIGWNTITIANNQAFRIQLDLIIN